MTPANEAWIREIAEIGGTGAAAKIARICLEELDSLRNQLKEATRAKPGKQPKMEGAEEAPIKDNPRTVSIAKERLEYLEIRDHRLTRWDTWARDVLDGAIIPPMPVAAVGRRKKAGQA